jgi:hypothetical protein
MRGYTIPMRKAASAAVLALLAGVLWWGTTMTPSAEAEAATIGSGITSFAQLSDRFATLAKEKGAVYAFDVLGKAPLPPNTDLHLLGHVVGDELYKQKGVAGIADCTQDFRNACSHAVVIGALNEFGPSDSTLKQIDDACHQAPGGNGAYTMCYHGLGHGVFAYFGYDLSKTVAFCKKMGTVAYHDEQYTQCVGGSIMELMGGGGHDHDIWLAARTKYLTATDPLAPCDTDVIPTAAKTYCYIYLTPRLFELAGAELAAPDPETFPKAFSFCDAIPLSDPSDRNSCFGGFGKEFIPLAGARDIRAVDKFSDNSYELAAGWCDLAAAKDGKQACIEQALESVFWGGENDPSAAFRFCSLVPDTLSATCYARLANNIGRYLPPETAKPLCDKLPERARPLCGLKDSSKV